jgi:hypothetical protein
MARCSGQDTGLAERAGLVTAASAEAVLINKPAEASGVTLPTSVSDSGSLSGERLSQALYTRKLSVTSQLPDAR